MLNKVEQQEANSGLGCHGQGRSEYQQVKRSQSFGTISAPAKSKLTCWNFDSLSFFAASRALAM
jgi:hypothetical protein